MMAPEMTWVVETGIPKWAVVSRMPAEVVSAANPWTGSSLATRWPIVFMIRQPPTAVPRESAVADTMITQVGTTNSVMTPVENRASVMMPIVFWASLVPWANAMKAAEKTCSRRNRTAIGLRWDFRKIQKMAIINANAMAKPSRGDVNIGMRTLFTIPLTFRALVPAAMIVAPSRPPIRA